MAPCPSTNRPRWSRRQAGRWIAWAVVVTGAVAGLLTVPMAFTTVITPPAAPRDPVTVIIVDHSHTPSLILPAQNGTMVRYAYGDWRWYALGETGLLRGVPTLAWPTQGALGRMPMEGPIRKAAVQRQMRVGFERMHRVKVERTQAQRLRTRLDELYEQNRHTHVYNQASDLHFVHHPQRYTYFFNSNHMLAAWLKELGCGIRGPAFASRWRVTFPEE